MIRSLFSLVISATILSTSVSLAAGVHHELRVRLEPSLHEIDVDDRITLPAGQQTVRFLLHAALEVTEVTQDWELELSDGTPDWNSYGWSGGAPEDPPLREYTIRRVPADSGSIVQLRYRGKIDHPLVSESEEYARSFSRTVGTIDSQGVVLSASTFWVPTFSPGLLTFRLEVDLPQPWDAVSQGRRVDRQAFDGRRQVSWDSPEPTEEVYLIAAPFVEYERPAGEVTAMAFLREPDPNLAAKYLEATVQYVEMYRKLIGPYPYAKFALVENFWETGYGMPSFTLLGPKILRFPFILHSSYPHEILHNWWGNSVFVAEGSGNWCEGLTAYLADHLVKEGQGQGGAYRRDTLKKYGSFVNREKDFPLTEFRSRHSSSSEAIGYGKSLMLWHMVRRRIGDAPFARGLQRFYRSQRFRHASFDDLESAFSETSGEDLGAMFRQWVERSGAPSLELHSAQLRELETGAFLLDLELRQTQDSSPYVLSVPIAVTLEGEERAYISTVEMTAKRMSTELPLPSRPLRVDVDPEFDLFRRLDPFEISPSIGQLFGAERVTLVLPEAQDGISEAAWRSLADSWSREDNVELIPASELSEIPQDRAVWILGSSNPRASFVREALLAYDSGVDADSIRADGEAWPRAAHSFVLTARHPHDPALAVGWIGSDLPSALPGLARKLPHYGKYSYLAFSGEEPVNVGKGQWPALRSPMTRLLGDSAVAPAVRPAREPMARLEPAFDPQRLNAHVERLAAPEMEGRGVGSAGLQRASEYVARAFESSGLEPGGDDGSYFQRWQESDGPGGRPVELRNVIGILPGSEPGWQEQSIVIAAHLDHLGFGWPDVRSGDEGKLHPGADDNASGVAVLLELAELLGRDLQPRRSISFVAFTAEEWGLRGSRHFVDSLPQPRASVLAMINMDTVGRLGERKVTVFGTGSADEWIHIVRGIGFTTGIQADAVADDLGGSDQKSFLEAGVPAVQIFSGATSDYHRPSDLPSTLDAAGMVKIATFVREALVYLSEREEPLTSKLAADAGASPPKPPSRSGRRVSLGTLPEFTDPGPGVQIADVLPDTPAQKAGLQRGDRILAIDGETLADVRAYGQLLRERNPGDTLVLLIERMGKRLELRATLVAR